MIYKMYLSRVTYWLTLLLSLFLTNTVSAQVIDTIANWDGINVEWVVSAPSGITVENPIQEGINPSANCMEVTTGENPYDLILTNFSVPINFTTFPIYRLKILAPESGGNVLLKFENSDNTSWQEIEKTPIPGQWDDLEFDFSETTATDFTRMVIFFDFQGTNPGDSWFLDDVLQISEGSAGLTTNLPIIIINTNGVDIPDEPKITGNMGIIDNDLGNMNNQYDPPNDYDGFVGIEIRGQSSQMFPKKSYAFETRDEDGENLNVPILGMPSENDWILYAPYSDKSMLRNFISFYMGSKLGPYCTRMAYCEVIINNDYMGVYILMEKIKRDDNRVDIAKLKTEDISGDELTGGYIVKVDKIDPDFQFGIDGWKSIPTPSYPNSMNIIFQFYYPKAEDIVQQQRNYIEDYISTSENALTSPSFADPNYGYNNYLDVASFVDQMILCEISKEVDKYRYSTYFYKEKDSDGGKLFAGPAWDFNLGYSNVDFWDAGNDYSGWLYPMVNPNEWSIMFWWKRMMEDPYFKDMFHTRWQQLREDELSDDKLEYAIDSIVGYIDEAQQRNYERWPILGQYVWPNYNWQGNNYYDEVAFFETWFFNRINWIDNNISGSSLTPSAELSNIFLELEITLADEYFNSPILENNYFELNNAPAGMIIESVNYLNASQATIQLSGSTTGASDVSVTLKAEILNGFIDITTNELSLGNDFNLAIKSKVILYTSQNTIHLKCQQPELLGDKVEIFNLMGQRIKTSKIDNTQLNSINVNAIPGIYLCRYKFDEKMYRQHVVFVN